MIIVFKNENKSNNFDAILGVLKQRKCILALNFNKMQYLYNTIVFLATYLLQIFGFLNPKIRLFIDGRKNVFDVLIQNIHVTDRVLWFHAASLGEYEQGLPVIEQMKKRFPSHKIVVSFFSPSGFEVKKNNQIADITVYLPLDSPQNVSKFLDLTHPEMAFFIKYEFWPNYLSELKKRGIKTFLISGIFRKNQLFFCWYCGFFKKMLHGFEHFFVQNENAKNLLNLIGFQNITVSGDTRFDRVFSIVEQDNTLQFVADFKNNITTIVAGSTWSKDENVLVSYINNHQNLKWVIAPHNIDVVQILKLKNSISKKVILFSEKEGMNMPDFDVMIIDTIGLLTKIYQYADIAYVGGGFGNPGVHNLLEPAVFGVPIIIGPNFSHFEEAVALVNMGGCTSILNPKEATEVFDKLIQNQDVRLEMGHICHTFVKMNKGATHKIMNYFEK